MEAPEGSEVTMTDAEVTEEAMQEDTEKPTEESINPETSDEQPMDAEAESSAPKKDYDSDFSSSSSDMEDNDDNSSDDNVQQEEARPGSPVVAPLATELAHAFHSEWQQRIGTLEDSRQSVLKWLHGKFATKPNETPQEETGEETPLPEFDEPTESTPDIGAAE
eukprot:m.46816 g.46816  ORF g.46816 m.46816 type:complete len:164 (-) comp10411_c1_seq1:1591-2082(-)